MEACRPWRHIWGLRVTCKSRPSEETLAAVIDGMLGALKASP